MRILHILRARVRSVLFRSRREHELDEELRLHLEQQAEQWMASGVEPGDAMRRARQQFGNIEMLKEESRDARGTAAWDALARDIRQAVRRLLREWRFSGAAILLLALGLGLNTALFSLVNATLFRPAPFADASRLVDIYRNTPDGAPGTNSYPVYRDIAADSRVFSRVMSTTVPVPVKYRDRSGPVRSGLAEYATVTYPEVLGIQPSLGRWFLPAEARPGVPLVGVVGYQTWSSRFNADPAVIGRTIYVQGEPVTVIGVGPKSYPATLNVGVVTDFWMPIESALGSLTDVRRSLEAPFFVKARLRAGVSLAQARAAMDLLDQRLAAAYPEDTGRGISVYASESVRVHPRLDTLLSALGALLLTVVGLVLAIACSNLATLLLVRAAARSKEVSIRLAIGATRWQVIRHLLTESVLLSLAGGALGCVLAWWLIRALRTMELPIAVTFSVDPTVLGFAAALSMGAGVLFGLAPALTATRLDLLSVIREDGRMASVRQRWLTLRNGLVMFQVAASVVMLAATGAFLQMGDAARAVRTGFAVDGVAWLESDARYAGYTSARAGTLYEELRRRAAALPGVEAVTLLQGAPMERATVPIVINRAGSADATVDAGSMWAGPGFFDVMRIPILIGRPIDDRDQPGTPPVAVITESMARKVFGGINAVGRSFRTVRGGQTIEVVGVVADTGSNDRGGDLTDARPEVFFRSPDQAVVPPAALALPGLRSRTVAARSTGDASALLRDLQRELLAVDPSLPILSARTMAEQIEQSLAMPRIVALSLGSLGAFGLMLAGVGLYAVVAFAVSRRVREIGIRMALGARSSDVVRNVARDVAGVTGTGAGVGLALSLLVIAAMRTFSTVSSGVANISIFRPHVDPLQLAMIVGFVTLVGLVAALVPSRRAAAIDPLVALRHE